ncbi:WD40/YVTN/BNR-like repeat-containing protein [Marinobacter fonticola]|uniref:WD40/YVTN/BNR-like repeat-containing protein n=1 Tax=Marinobacter fonticola TaxID=2603215 RepID=UPI0011E6E554|nr:hypothetical protein [Marinobacter fonticola]
MRAIIHSLSRAALHVCALTLAIVLPALVHAHPADDSQPVKALTTNSSGALLVLKEGSLFSIQDGASTEIPLPATEPVARPTSLAKGANGSVYLAGPGVGVWRYSGVNEGWQPLDDTLPDLGVTAMAAHSTQSETLYAYLGKDGMFRTRNGGAEWVKVDNGPQEPVQSFLHSNMPGSMESGWLFAGTTRGVARSMDCFCFWGDAGDLRGTVSAISYDPAAPENVYAIIEGQLHHSADGGETWTNLKVPHVVTALAFSPSQGLVVGTENGNLFARGAAGKWKPVHG